MSLSRRSARRSTASTLARDSPSRLPISRASSPPVVAEPARSWSTPHSSRVSLSRHGRRRSSCVRSADVDRSLRGDAGRGVAATTGGAAARGEAVADGATVACGRAGAWVGAGRGATGAAGAGAVGDGVPTLPDPDVVFPPPPGEAPPMS
jgi:hypothetical protein